MCKNSVSTQVFRLPTLLLIANFEYPYPWTALHSRPNTVPDSGFPELRSFTLDKVSLPYYEQPYRQTPMLRNSSLPPAFQGGIEAYLLATCNTLGADSSGLNESSDYNFSQQPCKILPSDLSQIAQ